MIVIRRLLILVLAVIFLVLGINIIRSRQNVTGVVKAFGPLIVTFPSEPMFDSSNFYPGKIVEKTFTVENTDDKKQLVMIKASQVIIPSVIQLSGVLNIVISQNGKSLYGTGSPTGKKTLAAFLAEKDGVKLSNLNPLEKSEYDMSVQMDNTAGDEYQGRSISFDIIVGIDTGGLIRVPTIAPIPTIRQFPIIIHFPTFPQLRIPFFNNHP